MTGSDASGQSGNFPGSPMINLDSPVTMVSKDKLQLAEFDPLTQIRQSVSHDSLLFDPYHQPQSADSGVISTRLLPSSPTPTPNIGGVQRHMSQTMSTSPRSSQSSPRGSMSIDTPPLGMTSCIARPRPRGRSDPPEPHFVTSAPSSRSQSPKLSRAEKCPHSPTGSIKSQQYFPTWEDDPRPPYRSDSTGEFDFGFEVKFNLDDNSDFLLDWSNAHILNK